MTDGIVAGNAGIYYLYDNAVNSGTLDQQGFHLDYGGERENDENRWGMYVSLQEKFG